jgi:hypothetical protein
MPRRASDAPSRSISGPISRRATPSSNRHSPVLTESGLDEV